MDKREAQAYIDSLRVVWARDRWRSRGNTTLWVVLHSMEMAEMGTSAESLANYFANPGNRTASTQFGVDNNSTIRMAELDDIVAGARGANHKGIHIEQAGYAKQSSAEWRDAYSTEMIRTQTAPLVAALCVIYDLPVQFVKADGLTAGVPGITTHAECWKAFGGDYRYDPGENYPVAELLEEVRAIIEGDDLVSVGDDILRVVNALTQQVADLRSQVQTVRDELARYESDSRAYEGQLPLKLPNDPRQFVLVDAEQGLSKRHIKSSVEKAVRQRSGLVQTTSPLDFFEVTGSEAEFLKSLPEV